MIRFVWIDKRGVLKFDFLLFLTLYDAALSLCSPFSLMPSGMDCSSQFST